MAKLWCLLIGVIQFVCVTSTRSNNADISASEPWFIVGDFREISYFATFEVGLEQIRAGTAKTGLEIGAVYESFVRMGQSFEYIGSHRLYGFPTPYQHMREVEIYINKLRGIQHRGQILPTAPYPEQELLALFENMVCICLETTFARTVNDRFGSVWLFSDSVADEDAASLQLRIVESFEVTHQAARIYYMLHYPELVQTFDRFYTKCIGDKIAALDTN